MKNERPQFDLANADKVTDQQFADMLDGEVQFIGNLSHFKDNNVARWNSIRALRGKVGETWTQQAGKITENWHRPERPLTPQEVAARQEFSEESVRQLYLGANGTGESIGDLEKRDPAAAERARLAANTYKNAHGEPIVPRERPAVKVSESARGHHTPVAPQTPAPKPPVDLHEKAGLVKRSDGVWEDPDGKAWNRFFKLQTNWNQQQEADAKK